MYKTSHCCSWIITVNHSFPTINSIYLLFSLLNTMALAISTTYSFDIQYIKNNYIRGIVYY